jgi:hypothetical protein
MTTKEINTKRVFLILVIIITVLAVIATAEKYYWRYWPFEPLVVHSIKVTNPGKTVLVGTLMLYDVNFDKNMDVNCVVKRQLVNHSVINYEPIDPPRKPTGKNQTTPSSIQVPGGTDAAQWFMRWTAECKVGPEERIIAVKKDSEMFTVVRDHEEKGERGIQGPRGKEGKPGKNFWGK